MEGDLWRISLFGLCFYTISIHMWCGKKYLWGVIGYIGSALKELAIKMTSHCFQGIEELPVGGGCMSLPVHHQDRHIHVLHMIFEWTPRG